MTTYKSKETVEAMQYTGNNFDDVVVFLGEHYKCSLILKNGNIKVNDIYRKIDFIIRENEYVLLPNYENYCVAEAQEEYSFLNHWSI